LTGDPSNNLMVRGSPVVCANLRKGELTPRSGALIALPGAGEVTIRVAETRGSGDRSHRSLVIKGEDVHCGRASSSRCRLRIASCLKDSCELLGLNPRTAERLLQAAPESLRRLGQVRVFRHSELPAHLRPQDPSPPPGAASSIKVARC
jgi:hypothetical protein